MAEDNADTDFALDIMSRTKVGPLPSEEEVLHLADLAAKLLEPLPALVHVELPKAAVHHVVGDIHGQFEELESVMLLCGQPETSRHFFTFNGDFVDRGSKSVEVLLTLLSLLVAYPMCVFLNRGNHETRAMNRMYGFEREVLQKYSVKVFERFQYVFEQLPLAVVINHSIFVVHGGLSARDGVTIEDIAKLERRCQPRDGLIMELLWSDPMHEVGRRPSPRGAGVLFGPDVAARFCDENMLLCCIRSHQVVQAGYMWQRGRRCLTVFSAANYVGRAGNLGAVCHITSTGGRIREEDMSFSTFSGRRNSLESLEQQSSSPLSARRRSLLHERRSRL